MSIKQFFAVIFIGLVGAGLYSSLFTVHQSQQAVVFQFGDYVRTIKEPGLAMKLPVLQQVVYFEKRILDFDPTEQEVILGDEKRLVVDSVTRFRITDPLRYYQRFPSGESGVRVRLQEFVNASVRSVLGKYGLKDLLSEKRSNIMAEVERSVNTKTNNLGIEIVDVLIKRADLPSQNTEAVLRSMQKERERIAAQFRAQGQLDAKEIRSEADRMKTVILAEAERESQILRGQGDRASSEIFASAFSIDPKFYEFYRTMEAYQTAFKGDNASLVLSPESEFFKYFRQLNTAENAQLRDALTAEEEKKRLKTIESRVETIEGIVSQHFQQEKK